LVVERSPLSDVLHRSDEELIEDYLAGEVGAFRSLIERHHDALFRFLFRLTGSRHIAEDVFQDTFLQIHQSLDTFDVQRRFKPWLFTIAANKARDAIRKSRRRTAVSLSAPVDGGDGDSATFVDLMSVEIPHAASDLERQEQSRMVQRAIDSMSPRLREILLLAYFQKMSYADIAELFGVPLGTVKSRLHAAVAAFARAWQAQVEESRSRTENARAARRSEQA